MKKDVIVSGIQPTGQMHIGNYLGALKDWVELQDKYECFFFVADLHSLTADFDPKEKQHQVIDLVKTFLAVGLDPKKCTIFVQSLIPAHSELTWILDTVTPINELERMTQYKDKAARQKENINMGLFGYPVLQAADILLYKAQFVPVGHDQVQHLELTNLVGRKFNKRYGKYFAEIKPYMKQPMRIMSLVDPDRKMSKSEPDSTISIFDTPELIKKRLSKAVTATDAPKGEIPKGVANLFELMQHFGPQKLENFKTQYSDGTIKYSELKNELAASIAEYFAPMREKYLKLTDKEILDVIAEGSQRAGTIATKTLEEVREKIGLI